MTWLETWAMFRFYWEFIIPLSILAGLFVLFGLAKVINWWKGQ